MQVFWLDCNRLRSLRELISLGLGPEHPSKRRQRSTCSNPLFFHLVFESNQHDELVSGQQHSQHQIFPTISPNEKLKPGLSAAYRRPTNSQRFADAAPVRPETVVPFQISSSVVLLYSKCFKENSPVVFGQWKKLLWHQKAKSIQVGTLAVSCSPLLPVKLLFLPRAHRGHVQCIILLHFALEVSSSSIHLESFKAPRSNYLKIFSGSSFFYLLLTRDKSYASVRHPHVLQTYGLLSIDPIVQPDTTSISAKQRLPLGKCNISRHPPMSSPRCHRQRHGPLHRTLHYRCVQ